MGGHMNIVLVEPEIPGNTGTIARTCAATGAALHLVHPLGFSLEDRYLRRAGLDYWSLLTILHYDSFRDVRERHPDGVFHFLTTHAGKTYTEVAYGADDFLVFGKETRGLPPELIAENRARCCRIPMLDEAKARSLNLSNAVGIVLYEALRQNGFGGLR